MPRPSLLPLFTLLPLIRVLGSPYPGFRIKRAPIALSGPLATGPALGGDHNILWGWIKMRKGECSTGRRERHLIGNPFRLAAKLRRVGWSRSGHLLSFRQTSGTQSPSVHPTVASPHRQLGLPQGLLRVRHEAQRRYLSHRRRHFAQAEPSLRGATGGRPGIAGHLHHRPGRDRPPHPGQRRGRGAQRRGDPAHPSGFANR